MQSAAEGVRHAVERWLDREREAEAARATGVDVADAERLARHARAALGTGEVRELLDEAVSTRAIDAASHGALLEHLAHAAEAEVFARRSVTLPLGAEERAIVEDRQRTLLELAHDTRSASIEIARVATAALATHAADGRSARLEAFAEAGEIGRRIRARGPAATDVAPDSLAEECAGFLDATEDAARDLVARAHHAEQAQGETLLARLRALSVPSLDGLATPRGRARRIGAVFAAVGLGTELTQRVETRPSSLLALAPTVQAQGGRAVVLTSALEIGVTTERALLGGVADALLRALVSPALTMEHARPPTGSVARAMGTLFEGLFAHPTFLTRHFEQAARETARVRTASAAALVLTARAACVPVLLGPVPSSLDAARELTARALLLDPALVPLELAWSSRVRRRDALTNARARLAALAWGPALRERYDEDYFRNPRSSDLLRGAAARGGLASVEQISAEIASTPALSISAVVELAERAG